MTIGGYSFVRKSRGLRSSASSVSISKAGSVAGGLASGYLSQEALATILEGMIARYSTELGVKYLELLFKGKEEVHMIEMAKAISERDFGTFSQLVSVDIKSEVTKELFDLMREAMMAGAGFAAKQIEANKEPDFKVMISDFTEKPANEIVSIVNSEIDRIYRAFTAKRIQEISNAQINMVQDIIGEGVKAGKNPIEMARDVRDVINLTRKQAGWVTNYRKLVTDLDPQALSRSLRNRRYDKMLKRAIADGKPLPADVIDRMVDGYASKALKYRSETIARTEALRALHAGQHALFNRYVNTGLLRSDQVRRTWHNSGDSKVRDAHWQVIAQNPDGVALNEPFKTPLGPLMYPGDPDGLPENIINCRCVAIYRIISKEIADEIATGQRVSPYAPGKIHPGSKEELYHLRREAGVGGKIWFESRPSGPDVEDYVARQFQLLPGNLGTGNPVFFSLKPSMDSAEVFRSALAASRAKSEWGWMVELHDLDYYRKSMMFLSKDHLSGFAITPDGNIVSVFNNPNSFYEGVTDPMIRLAVERGGIRLDAFDTILPHLYSRNGFKASARVRFNPVYAPEGWPYKKRFLEWVKGNISTDPKSVSDAVAFDFISGDSKLSKQVLSRAVDGPANYLYPDAVKKYLDENYGPDWDYDSHPLPEGWQEDLLTLGYLSQSEWDELRTAAPSIVLMHQEPDWFGEYSNDPESEFYHGPTFDEWDIAEGNQRYIAESVWKQTHGGELYSSPVFSANPQLLVEEVSKRLGVDVNGNTYKILDSVHGDKHLKRSLNGLYFINTTDDPRFNDINVISFLEEADNVKPLFQWGGIEGAKVVIVEIDGNNYVLTGGDIVRKYVADPRPDNAFPFVLFSEKDYEDAVNASAEKKRRLAMLASFKAPTASSEEFDAWHDTNKKFIDRMVSYKGDGWLEKYNETIQSYLDQIKFQGKNGHAPLDIISVVNGGDVGSIIDSGRLKNQHETGTSGGALIGDRRKFHENILFGIDPVDSDPDAFPIYGALHPEGYGYDRFRGYGSVAFVMKDDLMKRSTFTYGDTLDNNSEANDRAKTLYRYYIENGVFDPSAAYSGEFIDPKDKPINLIPTPITNPDAVSVGLNPTVSIESPQTVLDAEQRRYVEAQIHGGVTLDDVAYVLLDSYAIENDSTSPPVEEIESMLREAGIAYKVIETEDTLTPYKIVREWKP